MRKKRQKWYQKDLSEDINYRGPLSYRHFKILGWIMLAIAQIATILALGLNTSAVPESLSGLQTFLSLLGSMSLPLFLIANFSKILDDSDGYRSVIVLNGSIAGIITGLFLFVYNRYVVGIASAFLHDRSMAISSLKSLIGQHIGKGYISFNIFIDLFLCALTMYFLNAKPKEITGKKLLAFRALTLLPVIYEIVSIVLKLMASAGTLILPVSSFPFLTTKPPLTFFVFLILALYLKKRESNYIRAGHTYEEYQVFQQTNRNSFHFSKFAAVLFVLAGVFDLLLLFIISIITTISIYSPVNSGPVTVDEITQFMTDNVERFIRIGIGKSSSLIFIAPIMLLFSYTRTHKYKNIDTLIPLAGVVLIIIVYLECAYFAASHMSLM